MLSLEISYLIVLFSMFAIAGLLYLLLSMIVWRIEKRDMRIGGYGPLKSRRQIRKDFSPHKK